MGVSKSTALVAALLFALASCRRSVPPTAGGTLHGELRDPVGDARSDPRVPLSLDLVRATVDVLAGNVTISIQFAPATLDRQTAKAGVALDTDQNRSTGITTRGFGVDYNVDLTVNPSEATISKADPAGCAARNSCFTPVGSVPLTIAADRLQLVVPLSLLANTNGRICFSTFSYGAAPGVVTSDLDAMPDFNLPPACVR